MTSSLPSDALHFRGETLTPESPRPVHIPEPSNIPVLEKQIDPIFNLMSTHLESPHALRDLTAMDYELARHKPSVQHMAATSNPDGNGEGLVYSQRPQNNDGTLGGRDIDTKSLENVEMEDTQKQSESFVTQTQISSLDDQPSTSVVPHDTLPISSQIKNEPTVSGDPSSGLQSQIVTEPYEPNQAISMTQGQSTTSPAEFHDTDQTTNLHVQTDGNSNEDVSMGGVNYQTLLDHISPSNVVASYAENIPAATFASSPEQVSVSGASSANPLSAVLPSSAGLPPRPPPQEKPAIHPNYTPGEDIRSYHYPHIHQSKAHSTLPSQPSNSYRPAQGYPNHSVVAAGAPGTSSTPNGLPPPPLATFQQPPRNYEQPRDSPSTQNFRQRDGHGMNGTRSVASAGDDDDGMPWAPDIQRKYDQFLSDERTYVTEGLWDRFPPGSRLFVGMWLCGVNE